MDKIDKNILSQLQNDGRMSNITLAETVGLSPSACLRRVQALEENGTIQNYTAILDEKQLGMGSQIIVMVTLSGQGYDRMLDFEKAIIKIPNVLACYLMGGQYDYLVRLSVRDLEHYEDIHRTQLSQLPHVQTLQSNFAMREVIKRINPVL